MSKITEQILSRRGFLTAAAAFLGAIGAAFAAVPFIRAMSPTKDILAAGTLEVDISSIPEGGTKTVIWRKQPVFILRRTPQMIEEANRIDPHTLSDPANPEERVVDPKIFVAIAICTHLGCIPKFMDRMPDTGVAGFYCPCHGGKYDNLGRRLGGPPPENLHLVPYALIDSNRLLIGTERFAGYGENVRKVQELPKV
ncbi:MAG TPA: ubiquinol-cytochrome c reductase iron-sulfur subunit [Deltaproteobacteria bacterium]|nr:MAG: ubiquinol-cytochrome c reductase iron-sulfur subunit [Deltaproteobacteria bacterium GWC2_55_46]HBG46767.1 ubiquinol-cytochrome c reductase iron-sulfur subunit [Deltaproteobacteria bacterium]HCY11224.1 ubiquinol-cytochrome c reductase iron-sulfur subunit [Deltaproteobacteria bacterium]